MIRDGAKLRLCDLFQHYREYTGRHPPEGWNDLLAGEVFERLRRLEWLEWELRKRDLEARDPRGVRELDARAGQLMIEIPILGESWYYMAFRTMRLIAKRLPELASFEIRSITLTRNKLIEHDDAIFNAGVALGENGPEIKAARFDGQSGDWPDAGVFQSAGEFEEALRELLKAYPLRNVTELYGPSSTAGGGLEPDGRSVVGVLPEGARPSTMQSFKVQAEHGETLVTVLPDGAVLADPKAGRIPLDGISFSVD